MNKEKLLRSLINEIILKEGGLEPTPGRRVFPDAGIPFSEYHDITFGPWQGFQKYAGDPGYIVFKLNKDPNNPLTSYAAAKKLGAKPIPDSYLLPGHAFYSKLQKELSNEGFRRNIEIAKAKNDADVDKTLPFNGNRSFYVIVDNKNPNLIDQYAVDADRHFNEETFLGLLLNNPLKGYGKLIKRLPPLERDHFISFLTKLAAVPSAISGASGLAGWAFKVPGLKQASGVIGVMSMGSFLGLSSIAAEQGDPTTAAMYLFAAAVTPWGAYHEITGAFVTAVNTSKTAGLANPGMQTLFESVGGQGKITLIDKFIDFLKIVWQRFAVETNIGWRSLSNNLWEATFAGKNITFTNIEKEFIQTMLRNKAIIEFADELNNIWTTIKAAIGTIWAVTGITFDIQDIVKPVEVTDTGKTDLQKLTKEQLNQYINTARSNLRQSIMKYSKKQKTSEFYDSIKKVGKTIVINKDNMSQQKEVSQVKIVPLNNMIPDVLFVPSSVYDVYETLVTFPESFFNARRNVFIQDIGTNAVFMFKINDITM